MQKLRWWLVEILGDSFVVAAARGWGGGVFVRRECLSLKVSYVWSVFVCLK